MVATVYGVDLGGTNLRIAEVDPILGTLESDVVQCDSRTITSNEQLLDIIESVTGEKANIAFSIAGPINKRDPLIVDNGVNMGIDGQVTVARQLAERGHIVGAVNDLVAAAKGEAVYGFGKDHKNILVATYSTGFNAAVARDRNVETQAELGHVFYRSGDLNLQCGCGGFNHLETYVSGSGVPLLANGLLASQDIEAKDLYGHFDENNPVHAFVRDTQSTAIAYSLGLMNSAYNPLDKIVLIGSQTNDWDVLFEPAIHKWKYGAYQHPDLSFPDVVKTSLPEIGVQGAVAHFYADRQYFN